MIGHSEDLNFDFLKEKIKALQDKYRENEDLFCLDHLSDGGPEGEVEDRFQDIYKGLLPCKLELSNIEEDLRNLKRRYKTPQECLDSEKTATRQGAQHRLKVRDSYTANEEDVKHMVMDSLGRSYTVHVPLSVLSLEDDFLINNDLVLCKVSAVKLLFLKKKLSRQRKPNFGLVVF